MLIKTIPIYETGIEYIKYQAIPTEFHPIVSSHFRHFNLLKLISRESYAIEFFGDKVCLAMLKNQNLLPNHSIKSLSNYIHEFINYAENLSKQIPETITNSTSSSPPIFMMDTHKGYYWSN